MVCKQERKALLWLWGLNRPGTAATRQRPPLLSRQVPGHAPRLVTAPHKTHTFSSFLFSLASGISGSNLTEDDPRFLEPVEPVGRLSPPDPSSCGTVGQLVCGAISTSGRGAVAGCKGGRQLDFHPAQTMRTPSLLYGGCRVFRGLHSQPSECVCAHAVVGVWGGTGHGR